MVDARFPTTGARQELRFTPSTAVRANLDVRTGAGAVGAALQDLGGELQQQNEMRGIIEDRNRANLDSLSSRKADIRRKQTATEIADMKTRTPPEQWEPETIKIVTRGNEDIAGFNFSPEASEKQQIISEGDLITIPAGEFVNASRVISRATIVTAEEKLTDDYRLGKEDIAQSNIDFIETMKRNGVSAPEILLKRKAAEVAGTKARYLDQSKLRPDEIIAIMQAKKKTIGAKGVSDEGLFAKDYEDIISSALSAKSVAMQIGDIRTESQKDMLGKALQDRSITYDLINSMDALDEDTQESYRIKMNTEAARAAKGLSIVTNQSIKGDLEDFAYKIWQGAVDKQDYDDMLLNARYGTEVDGKMQYVFNGLVSDEPFIDDGDYDILRTLGATELKTSQAKGLSESSSYAKGQLVEVSNDIDFASIIRGLEKPEQDKARSERKVQLENWSQFNHAMKLWQQENPDSVESDYYIESRKKLPFYYSRSIENIIGGNAPREFESTPIVRIPKSSVQVDAVTGAASKVAPSSVRKMVNPKGVVFQVLRKDIEKYKEKGWTFFTETSKSDLAAKEKRYQEYLKLKAKVRE